MSKLYVVPGSLQLTWRDNPNAGEVQYTGKVIRDLNGSIDMVASMEAPYLIEKTPTERLADVKAEAKLSIREQAYSLIVGKWPIWKQSNAQMGVYPIAVLEECQGDIAAVIQASNAAEDAIDAAATIEAVEAVSASWPVI